MSEDKAIKRRVKLLSANANAVDVQFIKGMHERAQSESSSPFRTLVLTKVAYQEYEQAIEAMDKYFDKKHQYQQMRFRIEPYIKYGKGLIRAIESKRGITMYSDLSLARQQELVERVFVHFEELKDILRKICIISKEETLADLKSSVFTLKILMHGLFMVILFGVGYDLIYNLSDAFSLISNDFVNKLSDLILSLLDMF